MPQAKPNIASIGLKAKTGRAIAVVLVGPPDSPQVIQRAELMLTDASIPGTFQPYHEVMELPWEKAEIAVKPFVAAIETVAAAALRKIVHELKSENVKVAGVGIAGAPDRNLYKIGNFHIRAHAAEGVLFRRVLESAAKANILKSRSFAERGFEELAALEFGWSVPKLKNRLAGLGRSVGPPWRSDQRVAATAAWLTLLSPTGK